MSQPPGTPNIYDSYPGTPGGADQTPRNTHFSSHLDVASPRNSDLFGYSARTPGTPRRAGNPYGRGEMSPMYFGDDMMNATSPLAYPSTPMRHQAFSSPMATRTPRATYVRTPHLNTQFTDPQSALNTPGTPGFQAAGRLSSALDTQESDPSLSVRLIWGTTINIHESMTSFRNFLNNFTLAHRKRKLGEAITDEDHRPFYPLLLTHVSPT